MERHYVARAAEVLLEDDGAHCSKECPYISPDKCRLWHVDLIRDDSGAIVHPMCRAAFVTMKDAFKIFNQRTEELLREVMELKAAAGHAIYCGHENPDQCGRSAIICTKGGGCDLQIEKGERCQGFEGPCMRMDAKRRRQSTQYVDNEERNWATYCPACQKGADEYWQERWDEIREL